MFSTRRRLAAVVAFTLLGLMIQSLQLGRTKNTKSTEWHVNPAHRKLVHEHVHKILEAPCRPNWARQNLFVSGDEIQPFLWRNQPPSEDLFLYPPPFGFRNLQSKVEELRQSLPASDSSLPAGRTAGECHRCVVIGNGGILKGLQLGSLIDRFHTVIRLNSGPLGKFHLDVGNRTSIRMSYPEGTPLHWEDTDPEARFVAVVYKGGDLSWTSAMINKRSVPLWDWLFFWQKVPDKIPLDPQMFRLLNPQVIRQTALDLLQYSKPRRRLWGSDKNIPTLGVSALNLATLLCDEVSLAGFGYNLTHRETPLHYYDQLPMSVMQQETMHNVNQETRFLQKLVQEGTVTDLTGGILCPFCSS